MILTPPAHARPSWLPLRIFIGSGLAAALLLLAHGASVVETLRLLIGLPVTSEALDAAHPVSILGHSAQTLLLMLAAGLVGFSGAVLVTSLTAPFGSTGLRLASLLGRLMAAIPAGAAAWIWLGWWIGDRSGTVETLMPVRPLGWEANFSDILARLWWREAAPLLWLSLTCMGLCLHTLAATLANASLADLQHGLVGRGLARSRIRLQHFTPLFWPLWQRRLEAIGFPLLIVVIPVEQILAYPGWGGATFAAMQSGSPQSIATCIYAAGALMAAWTLLVGLLRPHTSPALAVLDAPRRAALDHRHQRDARQTRQFGILVNGLSALLCAAVLLIWMLRPSAFASLGAFPQAAWQADLNTLLQILGIALLLGPLLTALRHTAIATSLRRFALLESLAWSPIVLWAMGLSFGSGRVVDPATALGLVGGVILAVELEACTRRAQARGYLSAARVLGASPWRAWRTHALPSWLQELIGTLIWLAAALWSAWFLIQGLGLPEGFGTDPSLGGEMARAAGDALQTRTPLLTNSLPAALSILCLWNLSRIILPSDDF
ncbi:MAG: hypothetical protein KDK99_05205 [Verrucomicrobiales bacterium]|nr:hypothetical protein [Verrucomicrobiales bacterium]